MMNCLSTIAARRHKTMSSFRRVTPNLSSASHFDWTWKLSDSILFHPALGRQTMLTHLRARAVCTQTMDEE
jgi:hypothetical protein